MYCRPFAWKAVFERFWRILSLPFTGSFYYKPNSKRQTKNPSKSLKEGGVRVCGDAVLRYFWCGFAVIFILTRGIAVSSNVGKFFWSWILKDCIEVQDFKEKESLCVLCSRPRAKLLFCQSKPIAFFRFLLPSPSSLPKLLIILIAIVATLIS